MDTENYCVTLDKLDKVKAIRAIHEALTQLNALSMHIDCGCYDNMSAIRSLVSCMRDAGHIGYNPSAGRV